jgi:hypothetical protein
MLQRRRPTSSRTGSNRFITLLAGLNDLVASQPGQGLIESAMPFRLINSEAALDLLKERAADRHL